MFRLALRLIAFLAVTVLASETARAGCDLDSFANDYARLYAQTKSPGAAAAALANRLEQSVKASKSLQALIEGVTDGTLVKEVENVIALRKAYKIDPRTLRSSRLVDYYKSLDLVEEPALPRLSGTFKALAGAVSVASFTANLHQAVMTGDRTSVLEVHKQSAEFGAGMIVTRIGAQSLKIGGSVVGFLDYALTSLMAQELASYEEYWWNAYSAYLNKRYPHLVKGANSWAALAMRADGGKAFEARLTEFWTETDVAGDGIGSAIERAAHYYKPPEGVHRDALAPGAFRKPFAARFYGDYLKATLDTHMAREAEKAADSAREQADRAVAALCAALGELTGLANEVAQMRNGPQPLTEQDKVQLDTCNRLWAGVQQADKTWVGAFQAFGNWDQTRKDRMESTLKALGNNIDAMAKDRESLIATHKNVKASIHADGKVTQEEADQANDLLARIHALTGERLNPMVEEYNHILEYLRVKAKSMFAENCRSWIAEMLADPILKERDLVSSEGTRLCEAYLPAAAARQAAKSAWAAEEANCRAVAKKAEAIQAAQAQK